MTHTVVTGILTGSKPELLAILDREERACTVVLASLDVVGDELTVVWVRRRCAPIRYGRLPNGIVDQINRVAC